MTPVEKLPLVVLISGSGSNLQAIIDGALQDLPVDIRGVISNRGDAYGLERAGRAGIATRVLDHRKFPDRESYDRSLADLVESYEPALVVLAGFMRILTPEFVRRFRGRMINFQSIADCTRIRGPWTPGIRCMAPVCISSPKSWMGDPSFCRPECRSCPATMPISWRRGC